MCFFGGELQIDAKNSKFDIFESALYIKNGSIPLKSNLVIRAQVSSSSSSPHQCWRSDLRWNTKLHIRVKLFKLVLRLNLVINCFNTLAEHFLDETGKVIQHPNSFLPFSAGRRVCLGESFAKAEIFLLFCWLLQHYTFSKAPGLEEQSLIKPDMSQFAMHLPKPFKVVARPQTFVTWSRGMSDVGNTDFELQT